MTTYYDAENSTNSGQPIECYEFIGTFGNYRYTSGALAVILGGNLYIPIPIERNQLVLGSHVDDSLDITIKIAAHNQLVIDYAFQVQPPDLSLTIYRFHRGTSSDSDHIIYWTGPIGGILINGKIADIRIPSVFTSALAGDIPSIFYQPNCNHALFDDGCTVDRSLFSFATTVGAYSGVDVTMAGIAPFPNGSFVGGELINVLTGESRLILSHVSTALVVNFPFARLVSGTPISASFGCDNSFTTCVNKFNNSINHAGCKFVPNINPFSYGI